MQDKQYTIVCAFDSGVKVWYIADSDVPGLSLEATSKRDMLRRIRDAVPELLELNSHLAPDQIERAPVELLWTGTSQRLKLKA